MIKSFGASCLGPEGSLGFIQDFLGRILNIEGLGFRASSLGFRASE